MYNNKRNIAIMIVMAQSECKKRKNYAKIVMVAMYALLHRIRLLRSYMIIINCIYCTNAGGMTTRDCSLGKAGLNTLYKLHKITSAYHRKQNKRRKTNYSFHTSVIGL